jgi:protein-disulfide isomerase
MKRYLPFLIIATVAVVAIAGSVFFYRATLGSANASSAAVDSGMLGPKPLHVRGNPEAPVTLEEFADFQCPACAIASGVISVIEKDYGSRLRVIFREFPLPMHKHGGDAARAAEAASLQGKFWGMHGLLYANQAMWSDVPDARPIFARFAQDLHLDVARFERDYSSAEVSRRISADVALGKKLGIENTPTIFVNKKRMNPPYRIEHLHEMIDAALSGGAKKRS